ncbi:PD-(D/E)XK nuclease family protein [Scatolibacter rhodanostii]|uniref:PD-(D/E)XK nuclease family protein n=1 Tax=Scatolibacter rhodanostii TaxID=2014781 RepID=UPI000C080118|nr:PD-(D/E)XK nuclease family protein [Scatolibacter rhodanostii]
MLQFVVGRAGSGKTEFLRRMLVDLSGSRQKLMILVPEQYSFETEKEILRLAGPRQANQIAVLSFTRLADLYFRTEGGVAGQRLSDGGRRMMMSLAAEACAEQLTMYQKAVKDGRITDIMLTAVNEMKICGISGDDLRQTANKLSDGGLADKLFEISLLYDTYTAMVTSSYLDSRDDLTRLAESLTDSEFLSGYTIAVDSFEGFTMQEMNILLPMMKKAENLVISLCTNNISSAGEQSLFALTNRTKHRLMQLAKENHIRIAPDVVLRDSLRFKNASLSLMEQHFFSEERVLFDESETNSHEDIHLFCARDIFEETDFVSATIRRLVMEKNLRYSDCSVVCRAPEKYAGILETAFQKRDIPCFVSHPSRVDAEPIMRFILCAFESVMHSMNPEDIFDMLKTGISGLTAEEISDIENYSYLWQLKGRHWKEAFTKHPRGFGQEMTDTDKQTLLALNQIRERIILPLTEFAEQTAHTTGESISHAVYALLTHFNMEENLLTYCKTLENMNQPGLAEKQIRIWDLLVEILEQMAAILGEKPITREHYYRLLREIIRGEDVSDIPQVLDSVMFGMPEQIRQTSPKVVFVLGAVQGEFPMIPKNAGVFSDSERQKLIELELPLSDPLPQKMIQERYLAYSIVSLASESLYLCYPKGANGEELQPSEIITETLRIFPPLSQEQFDRTTYFANSRESAFSLMAEYFPYATSESATLKALFQDDSTYQGRLSSLQRAVDIKSESIENTGLAKKIFGEIPYLSPTQIETFYKCKFRYFCQYGVSARERRTAEIDAMQYGSIMHYLFEHIFAQKEICPAEISDDELLAYIRKLIEDYVTINMGGWDSISAREQYRLKRMIQAAAVLVRHVAIELAQSRFQPEGFEVRLGKDFPALKIDTPEGNTVTIGGTIDRIDIYESTRGKFVRVIDYKTGIKKFNMTDVLYGLNVQMLVYLAALTEKQELLPAGILYTPLTLPSIAADRSITEAELKSQKDKSLRMTGLILKDSEIIHAMEENAVGQFIPAKFLKSGSPAESNSVLEDNQLRAVLDYSKSLIATMADTLYRGQIEARPVLANQLGCDYCPYRSVCGKEYSDKDIEKCSPSKADIITAMTKGKEDYHGENDLDE